MQLRERIHLFDIKFLAPDEGSSETQDYRSVSQDTPHLDVLVEDAPHGREGAVLFLVLDDPVLGRAQLLGVDKDEAAGLSEGLEDERSQPGETKRWRE